MLLNWAGGRFTPKGTTPSWRKSFDLCYWITDFEFAIQFDADSEPSTRLVKGVPITQLGLGAQDYRKELAPEALGDEPYCPFKSDVYQVGYCSIEIFCVRERC